ncbi:hypothetical protein HDU67_008152 [Dinochytrium kinnereticum]|nr:hypothetical protein HDU67_008152 [Dinochytrium kinnereticum]
MSRTASFVAGVTAGVIGGVYLAQTYTTKLPNVEATVKDLVAKATIALGDLQKTATAAVASATAPAPAKTAAAPATIAAAVETKVAEVATTVTTIVEEVILEQPKPDTN